MLDGVAAATATATTAETVATMVASTVAAATAEGDVGLCLEGTGAAPRAPGGDVA